MAALGEHDGAVVALDPRTGAVTVMASKPSYDPNALRSPAASAQQEREMSANPPTKSEVNRATQFGYAPGSTFKVVTATAAIDTGAYTPESTVEGRNGILVSGVPLQNDNNESFGADHAHLRARPLGQHRVGAGRRARRQAHARALHGTLRLRPQAAARLPRRRDVRQRRAHRRKRRRADEPAGRRRAHGHRPGQTRGDAAADGGGRRRRGQPRQADGPPPDRSASSTPKGAPCRRSPRACSRSS